MAYQRDWPIAANVFDSARLKLNKLFLREGAAIGRRGGGVVVGQIDGDTAAKMGEAWHKELPRGLPNRPPVKENQRVVTTAMFLPRQRMPVMGEGMGLGRGKVGRVAIDIAPHIASVAGVV
jgi:hypothetical protein